MRASRFSVVAAFVVAAVAADAARAEAPPASPSDPGLVELRRIERDYGLVPHAQSLAALDRLVASHPKTAAAARALVWRGQLATLDGDERGARLRYQQALEATPSGEQAAFAHRGLGDLDLKDGRFDDAEHEYRAALDGATPVLRVELREKRALVARQRSRRRLGLGCLGAWAAAAVFFAFTALRRRDAQGPLRVPPEAIYTLPIFAVLVGGARFSDRRVMLPLALCGAGALILIALSGAAQDRSPARRAGAIALRLAALLGGLLALFYFAAWRGDILDLLIYTMGGSPE